MAMSVDGLVSGLSTTDMINQLMQVETLPQTALKNKVTAQNKAVTAYQDVNTKLAALTTAAKALGSGDSWNAVKASSSSDAAIVTTTASAMAGTFEFKVDKLATTHTVTYKDASVAALTDAVVTADFINVLDADGNNPPISVDVSQDKSLKGVITAINNTADSAYKASAVQIAPGRYTLQLTAVASGFAGKFDESDIPAGTIDGLGEPTPTKVGQDAEITVGSGGGAYIVKSSSNTFTDVVAGVNIAVTRVSADPVTVSMVVDQTGITEKAQALVDAANAALTQIKTATAAKNGSTAAGVLAGDPTLRALSQEILSAVATGAGADLGSLAAVGITVERGGTLKFDKEKFATAYAADPAVARAYFDDVVHDNTDPAANPNKFEPGWDTAVGIARKLETIGLKATEGIVLPNNPTAPKEGTVAGLIKRRNESIAALTDQVEAWDTRLETRRASLQRQYSALEVALGKLKEQQSWLSGQLAGLS
jgi:flagellar hook-associated protein 2